jgi:hypothetical protein
VAPVVFAVPDVEYTLEEPIVARVLLELDALQGDNA